MAMNELNQIQAANPHRQPQRHPLDDRDGGAGAGPRIGWSGGSGPGGITLKTTWQPLQKLAVALVTGVPQREQKRSITWPF
jgi:hypothetical protein